MRPVLPFLLAPLVLVPLACGASPDPAARTDEAWAALSRGDHPAAQSAFEDALAVLKPGDPGWLRAGLGYVEALASDRPALARDELLRVHALQPAVVGAAEFQRAAQVLEQAGHPVEAVEVLEAATEACPAEAEELERSLRSVVARTEASGCAEQVEGLSSIGYLGDR